MSNFKIEYSVLASNDLHSIYNYWAEELDQPQAAKQKTQVIRQQINSLTDSPERNGRIDREPWYSLDIRKMEVQQFIVLYYITPEKSLVRIIRIFYTGIIVDDEAKDNKQNKKQKSLPTWRISSDFLLHIFNHMHWFTLV